MSKQQIVAAERLAIAGSGEFVAELAKSTSKCADVIAAFGEDPRVDALGINATTRYWSQLPACEQVEVADTAEDTFRRLGISYSLRAISEPESVSLLAAEAGENALTVLVIGYGRWVDYSVRRITGEISEWDANRRKRRVVVRGRCYALHPVGPDGGPASVAEFGGPMPWAKLLERGYGRLAVLQLGPERMDDPDDWLADGPVFAVESGTVRGVIREVPRWVAPTIEELLGAVPA